MDSPLVSAIIPVYNGEKYLVEAIESVLAQTYRHIELIVVDDGSTDRSAEVAGRYGDRLKYRYRMHGGAGAARNHGIDLAQGSMFAFLDADDIWVEDKISLQMAAFGKNPELDIVFGHVEQFLSTELPEELKKKIRCPEEIMPSYLPGTMLVRRESFIRVGPFSTEWRVGEGIDWYSRAKEKGLRVVMLPEVLMRRRLHSDNMGIRERGERGDYARVIKASLDRRRKEGRDVTAK